MKTANESRCGSPRLFENLKDIGLPDGNVNTEEAMIVMLPRFAQAEKRISSLFGNCRGNGAEVAARIRGNASITGLS
jgi:hypothetical protein